MRPQPGNPGGPSEVLLTLAVAVAAALAPLPILHHWFALLDEGYVLGIADEINRGKMLYRDVNVDAPFPGAFYLLALWFRWAGTSVEASRWLGHLGFVVYAVSFFRIARAFLSRGWAAGLVVVLLGYRVWAFPQWQIYSYSLIAATLVVLAAALTLHGARKRSSGWTALGGVVIGAAVMCKQDYGLAVTGGTGLALLVAPFLESSERPTAAGVLASPLLFGVAAVAVPVLSFGWLAWHGALDGLVQQTFVVPFTYVFEFTGYPRLPDFWSLGQDAMMRSDIAAYVPSIIATLWWSPCPECWVDDLGRGWAYRQTAILDTALRLVFWAPILATGLALVLWFAVPIVRRVRGVASPGIRPRLLLVGLAGGFLLAFNPPRDWAHLVMVYPPSIAVGAVLLRDGLERLPAAVARMLRGVVVACVVAFVLVTSALMDDLRGRIDYWVESDRAGVAIDGANGPIITDVLEYADREIDRARPVPVLPIQPMLGFLADLEPAGGFSVIWPVQDPSRDDRFIADMEERRGEHVIYSLSQYVKLGSFESNAPRLFEYLAREFEIDAVFSRTPFGPLVTALSRRAPEDRWSGSIGERVRIDGGRWVTWPFGQVLLPEEGSERVDLHLEASPATRELRLAYGVNPDRWLGLDTGPFTFRIAAREGDTRQVLFEDTLDPARRVQDRRWHPVRIDLAPYRGRAVDLSLEIDGVSEPLAGWFEPRVGPSQPAGEKLPWKPRGMRSSSQTRARGAESIAKASRTSMALRSPGAS